MNFSLSANMLGFCSDSHICECYCYHTYIETLDNLLVPMSNTDTVRIDSSPVLPSCQVMKCPDPAYSDLSSFSERATVI